VKKLYLPAFFFLVWFLLIFYFGNLAVYAPRFLDIVILPVYILGSYTLAGIYSKDKAVAAIIVVYLVICMFIFMYPTLKFRHSYNGEKEFALFVKEKTEPNAIIVSMDDSVFIEYYGARKSLAHPVNNWKEMHEFLRKVAAYLVRGIPVYLTGSGLSYDPKYTFRNIVLTNFDMTFVGSKLCEDYHRPELQFAKYDQNLYKLDFKFKKGSEKVGQAP
jgi:hypothetical protein